MKALVGVSSNIEPRRHVPEACSRLERDSEVLAMSRPWWTPAVGGPADSPPFLNCVALIETARRPVALRRWLQAIEHDHRRVRTHDRAAPRTLDLDVLALERPDGTWELRADLAQEPFHLLPLREVAPDLVLPDGRTVRQAAEEALRLLPGSVAGIDALAARALERPTGASLP